MQMKIDVSLILRSNRLEKVARENCFEEEEEKNK